MGRSLLNKALEEEAHTFFLKCDRRPLEDVKCRGLGLCCIPNKPCSCLCKPSDIGRLALGDHILGGKCLNIAYTQTSTHN